MEHLKDIWMLGRIDLKHTRRIALTIQIPWGTVWNLFWGPGSFGCKSMGTSNIWVKGHAKANAGRYPWENAHGSYRVPQIDTSHFTPRDTFKISSVMSQFRGAYSHRVVAYKIITEWFQSLARNGVICRYKTFSNPYAIEAWELMYLNQTWRYLASVQNFEAQLFL